MTLMRKHAVAGEQDGRMPRPLPQLLAELDAARDEFAAAGAGDEELRRAPDALVALMRRLRVPLVKAPAVAGGDELSPPDQLAYFDALAYADLTAGWIGFVHAGATGMAAAGLPQAGLERVFGGGAVPFFAGVVAPSGTCKRVEGGYLATGRWRYASGVHHSDYVVVTAMVEGEARTARLLAISTADVTLDDDWHVMSQSGTGSVDVVVDRAFVPDDMVVERTATRGGPMYSLLSPTSYIAGENLGFTLGAARRFLDDLVEYATTKSRGADGLLADRGAFQFELGRTALQVEAARALMHDVLTEVWARACESGTVTAHDNLRVAGALSYGTMSVTEAISRIFPFAGAGALHRANHLQRCFRDIHGSSQHYLASNSAYERYAQALLRPGRTEHGSGR
jgi:alkylation response protein AidB-like acyl-CoA dehydrogenase